MRMSLEDLVDDADVIVVGTVQDITSSWNDEKDSIYSTLTKKAPMNTKRYFMPFHKRLAIWYLFYVDNIVI